MDKIKVIVTGASGMVGEGVLLECLQNPAVEAVLVIGRRPCGHAHPKLTELIHGDLYDLGPVAGQLKGYDACYFCLGTTSVGKKEPEYFKVTYTLTLSMAKVMLAQNPGMDFCYVSGAGTNGNSMWARVKSKTEADLATLGFRKAYAFRPGYMHPTPGQKNTLSGYKWLGWMYPALRKLFPSGVSTLRELAVAMLLTTLRGYGKGVLEVKDFVALAATA